jgi:AraC family transcriptional regulator of adaptative response/methylated-DNA-[protein]-cysteine methyltransferase
VLFRSARDAEREGFQPCSRCSPARNAETLAESCVRLVIDHIESRLGQGVTAGSLARTTGLSPGYLQQAFKRIVGLTPRGYHDARRIEAFRARLRRGESIAGSAYAAGYGSSRALYESVRRKMGMTPATYRRGGAVPIRFAFAASSLGPVLAARTDEGPCAVLLGSAPRRLLDELRREFPRARLTRESPAPERLAAAVRSADREDPFVRRLPRTTRMRVLRARVMRSLRSGG